MDDVAIAARGMLAMEVARRAVRALAARGIDVMPLKGVLFLALGVPGSATRYVGDVDLLVQEPHLAHAADSLHRAGFREIARVSHARTLWHDELGFHVDLHFRLFPPAWFRLLPADVFARASRRDVSLGAPVLVMDRYDIYAHLVGHFAFGRHNASDLRHVADFGAVVGHFELALAGCADRLSAAGLARAARHVLRETAVGAHAAHARSVLAALPPDAVGDATALVAHAVLGRYPGNDARGIVPAHLLGETLPSALVAMGRRVWERR